MRTISCLVKVSEYDTIMKHGVTPAEAALLVLMKRPVIQENPIKEPKATGEIERTDAEEFDRLARLYGRKRVEKAFPGVNPTLPATFAAVNVKVAAAEAPETDTKAPEAGAEAEAPAAPRKARKAKAPVEVQETSNPE